MFKNTEEKVKHFTKELKSIFKKLNENCRNEIHSIQN